MLCYNIALLILVLDWSEASEFYDVPENQIELVDYLENLGHIRTGKVKRVMTKADRKYYCPLRPYEDVPRDIGFGVNISAPSVHAYALELLRTKLRIGNRALDVGYGSGYFTVCMAIAVGMRGFAVGIDHIEDLEHFARVHVEYDNHYLHKQGRIRFITGEGRLGAPQFGPYDVIHVGAAATEVPRALLQQLKEGGRMIIPLGPAKGQQTFTVIDKDINGLLYIRPKNEVCFHSLVDKEVQWPIGSKQKL